MKLTKRTALTRLTVSAAMTAIAMILVMQFPIPMPPPVSFLVYDAADIPVLIITMLYGPLPGLMTLCAVSLLQAFTTAAGNGWVGFVMHFVSSGTLVLLVGLFEHRFHKWKYTVIGMVIGVAAVVAVMIPFNLTLTVHFLGAPRAFVVKMLPYITAFNIIKPAVNCILTSALIIALKPILRKTDMLAVKR